MDVEIFHFPLCIKFAIYAEPWQNKKYRNRTNQCEQKSLALDWLTTNVAMACTFSAPTFQKYFFSRENEIFNRSHSDSCDRLKSEDPCSKKFIIVINYTNGINKNSIKYFTVRISSVRYRGFHIRPYHLVIG